MANGYFKNSSLTDRQAQKTLQSYVELRSTRDAARIAGTTRQTTSRLYLRLSKRVFEQINFNSMMSIHEARQGREGTHCAEIAANLLRTATSYNYQRYVEGTSYWEYHVARRGGRNADQDDVWVVAREVQAKWGKISKAAFPYHWAYIEAITEQRVNALMITGCDDLSDPRVISCAQNALYAMIEQSLRQERI